jgi:D-xylose transport system substrate-binding protein
MKSLVSTATLGGALVLAWAASGCGGGGQGGSGDAKIALLLSGLKGHQAPANESRNRPEFERAVKRDCPACRLIVFNAGGDIKKQEKQGDQALKQGADVLALQAVDPRFAAPIVEHANSRGVPVLAYAEMLLSSEPDYFVSFDSERVGEVQAEALADGIKNQGQGKAGSIVMLVGETGNKLQPLFEKGAYRGIKASGLEVAKRYSTPFWVTAFARSEMRRSIAAVGRAGFSGVYAETDDIATGAIKAMEAAGIDPAKRPTTGRNATPEAIRRILAGKQYMTVFLPVAREAAIGAKVAIDLAEGEEVPGELETGTFDTGSAEVPATLLEPVVVTRANARQFAR